MWDCRLGKRTVDAWLLFLWVLFEVLYAAWWTLVGVAFRHG